jgi:LysR family transcriptional regulator, hydrogen peroxide-inducible genes activator
MEMHQVRYFLALCEANNFTGAAQRCGVSQPSLTRAIKKLEAILGCALFYRSKSGTRLTKLGNLVKPRLRNIRLEAKHVHKVAQRFCKGWNELNQTHVDNRNNLPVQKMRDMSFVVSEAD